MSCYLQSKSFVKSQMEVRPVLIECTEASQLVTSSGLLLDNKLVLATGNAIPKDILERFATLESDNLIEVSCLEDVDFRVVEAASQEGRFNVRKAQLKAGFVSQNIQRTNSRVWNNWAFKAPSCGREVHRLWSQFYLLSFSQENFDEVQAFWKEIVEKWWDIVARETIQKGDELLSIAASFGNRNFLCTWSKGIVSNLFGLNRCYVLSDLPCTPGSEGGVVYKNNKPIGIILSSTTWWGQEWIGMTIICDIRGILSQFLDTKNVTIATFKQHFGLLASVEFGLVQVSCGGTWGTGLLVDSRQGLIVTNAHVIVNNSISLRWKNHKFSGKIIYKAKPDNQFDLALIKLSDCSVIERLNLKALEFGPIGQLGDTVYAAGYSLFKEVNELSPNLTKGIISGVKTSFIRTDCAVHPGSSGGAILRPDGRLIGVIVSNYKADNSVVYSRINIAISIEVVQKLIGDCHFKLPLHKL